MLYKRGRIWYCRFDKNGRRYDRSTRTTDRRLAEDYETELRQAVWRRTELGVLPEKTWIEAARRYWQERADIRDARNLARQLELLNTMLQGVELQEITLDVVDTVRTTRLQQGVSKTTVNRTLQTLRAVLNAAHRWGWVKAVPPVKLYRERPRDRHLSHDEADHLLRHCPAPLRDVVQFALATGLRERNIRALRWEWVDLDNRTAHIPADQFKTGKALTIPLNREALIAIQRQIGRHPEIVFTVDGTPPHQWNSKPWRRAVKDAGFEDLRFHDLRHSWASWHVQSGTDLYQLMALGGWSSWQSVQRYAHLNVEGVRGSASNIERGLKGVPKEERK